MKSLWFIFSIKEYQSFIIDWSNSTKYKTFTLCMCMCVCMCVFELFQHFILYYFLVLPFAIAIFWYNVSLIITCPYKTIILVRPIQIKTPSHLFFYSLLNFDCLPFSRPLFLLHFLVVFFTSFLIVHYIGSVYIEDYNDIKTYIVIFTLSQR